MWWLLLYVTLSPVGFAKPETNSSLLKMMAIKDLELQLMQTTKPNQFC